MPPLKPINSKKFAKLREAYKDPVETAKRQEQMQAQLRSVWSSPAAMPPSIRTTGLGGVRRDRLTLEKKREKHRATVRAHLTAEPYNIPINDLDQDIRLAKALQVRQDAASKELLDELNRLQKDVQAVRRHVREVHHARDVGADRIEQTSQLPIAPSAAAGASTTADLLHGSGAEDDDVPKDDIAEASCSSESAEEDAQGRSESHPAESELDGGSSEGLDIADTEW